MWGIKLDRQSKLQLWRQIYQSLREGITGGLLATGEALPSTRELANALCVSRNTVSQAYDMLIAEGFVISRQGSPTRVAEGLYLEKDASPAPRKCISHPQLLADFHTGRPDLREFPWFLWQQLLHTACGELKVERLGYTGPEGMPQLRHEIAQWLYRIRGLAVDPDDIFVTAGATHALHLIAQLLCADGRSILMEDPCHTGMRRTFEYKGCPIIPVQADEHGMVTERLMNEKNPCAVYVTPSHQFPLGGILPASRRAALIRFARKTGAYIIEDDYDSEFRYAGDPVAPLLSMDAGSVIYVGTFSKAVFPALRIGYVILPRALQKQWRALRTHTDVQNPPFEQAALAAFLQTRKLDRHVHKMSKLYGERRRVLLDALGQEFPGGFQPCGDAAGLHIAVDFPGMVFDDAFRTQCLAQGVFITPLEYHSIQKGLHPGKLLIGYGHLRPEEIKSGVGLLRSLIIKKKQEAGK